MQGLLCEIALSLLCWNSGSDCDSPFCPLKMRIYDSKGASLSVTKSLPL